MIMGRIQSNVGLTTGFPIQSTVDQLMAISARPRDRLVARNTSLQEQQLALTEISGLVLSVQTTLNRLNGSQPFHEKTVTSQDATLLDATVSGDPVPGSYQFTPIRQAQSQRLISAGFASLDETVGEGTLSLGFGGFLDQGMLLEDLNGGAGVQRGRIRITDRSGASQVIDLRFALTVDDVLGAINNSDAINVTAQTDGDTFRIIDNTGQTASNLMVQAHGSDTTAADLGLADIDVAASQATGLDVLRLHDRARLGQLNDGNGIALRSEQPDLEITFRDGSEPLPVDLDPASTATIEDLLGALNAADPTRLLATLSDDGDRLVLTDLTAGTGTFSVSSSESGQAAEDLGLTAAAIDGRISSRRLQAGLKTTLIDSLVGGAGLELGLLHLQDRSGAVATIHLTDAETIDDVINGINDAGIGLVAQINPTRNGILVTDTTGGAENLRIANVGGTDTADALGLTADQAASSVTGAPLHRQTVSHHTALDSLHGGQGVRSGSFVITDSSGAAGAVNLTVLNAGTVGDVIEAINELNIGVSARINDTGDGILLTDTAEGSATLAVEDVGRGKAATALRLVGEAVTIDIEGTPTQVIDGALTATIDIQAEDTLADVIEKINDLDAGVRASVLSTGSGATPYRLSLVSEETGRDAQMMIDTGSIDLGLQEINTGQDALLLLGRPDSPGAGMLLSAPTNTFDQVVDGLQLAVNGTSTEPVTVEVSNTDAKAVSELKGLVEKYNALRKRLDELTYFNEADNTTGILFGTSEALRIDTGFTRLLSDRFNGVGSVKWLEELGLSLNSDGRLTFDQAVYQETFANDPESVEQLFTDENSGVVAKFKRLIDQLAGEHNSVLTSRTDAMRQTIDNNTRRIESMNQRLERERERLLGRFVAMEEAVARMQSDLNAVSAIAALPPLTINSN
jgi:flagellar hook-associated protein 2